MENTELIFVRHCQSYGNVTVENAPPHHPDDPPLTPYGLLQADALATRFQAGELDLIFASTLLRTVQTVYPTAEQCGLQIRLLPELMEVGTKLKSTDPQFLKEVYPLAFFGDEDGTDAADETVAACKARAEKAMRKILEVGKGKRLLIASHGAFMGYLFRYVLDLDLPEPFAWKIENGCVTTVILRDGEIPLLTAANDCSHLLQL